MKKIIMLLLVGTLLSTSLAATLTAQQTHGSQRTLTLTTPPCQIQPTSTTDLSLQLTGESTYLTDPGCPKLPTLTRTVELPFAATNIHVTLTPTDVTTTQITGQIRPCPQMLPLLDDIQTTTTITTDTTVYASTTPYPDTWYTTSIGVGLNAHNNHVTFVTLCYTPIRYIPATNTLLIAQSATATITYTSPQNQRTFNNVTHLVIIAPQKFTDALQPLIVHKISHGIPTTLKTTEDIYAQYQDADKPEQIKHFIKDAIETQDITSVLLVGGIKNIIYSKPKDDQNQGSSGWYLPVRYTNLWDNPKFPLAEALHDPGVISDLYYADIYGPNGTFSSWDPNGDGVYAAWGRPGIQNDTGIDMYPDVMLGRLACTSVAEVRTVVNKIIKYENTTYDADWFKKMTVISGDGFLDQEDLNITWDTSSLPAGAYTINAQSSNPANILGPIETTNVTVDHTQPTNLTFNQDDNLRIHSYPGLPMAEICTVSEGNILGNTDFAYTPTEKEAYCNQFYHWANQSYVGGVLTIRGKSYDPEPYGNLSNIHVWITNSTGATVFEDWRNNTVMYWEGEYGTGEKALLGRGGALYYMPQNFTRDIIWASNGRLTGIQSVLDAWDTGAGFVFLSGHGSPNVWADHYPGIPGNRVGGSITGMQVTTIKPWAPYVSFPAFPMDTMKNKEKLPIAVVGGCHNSQFNVSMVRGLLDIMSYFYPRFPKMTAWCNGFAVPETFSWRLIRNPHGGAIASMGNTGLGYGMPGIDLTTGGGDSWITIEFFRQYGQYGHEVLGQAYAQTLTAYLNSFDMTDLAAGHPKTVQQWVLLGDPTLMIGGYPS